MSWIPWIHLLINAPFVAALVFLPHFPSPRLKPWLCLFVGLILMYLWCRIYKSPQKQWLWIHATVILPILMARILLPSVFLVHLCRALLGAVLFYHIIWIVQS